MSRIESTFIQLKNRQECALIPYLTVGYPTMDETPALIQAICASGADIVELGVPFSDPLADGPTIQEASQVALRNGITLRKCLETVYSLRKSGLETPFALMGYCNPFLAYSVNRLAQDAATCGVDGLIVPDLPYDEADTWVSATRANRLDLIFFVAPTTPEQRLRSVVQLGSGFLYCISLTGVTGARTELSQELPDFLGRVRSVTDLPLAVGFGISTPDHVRQVAAIADAAIVGSALITVIKRSSPGNRVTETQEFIRLLKAATRRDLNRCSNR